MIVPFVHNEYYRILSDSRSGVSEAGGNYVRASLDAARHNHNYWLSVPICVNDVCLSLWSACDAFSRLGKSKQGLALETAMNTLKAYQTYALGVLTYMNDFMHPYWTAANSFTQREKDKLARTNPLESLLDYLELLQFNLQVAEKGLVGSLKGMDGYQRREADKAMTACLNSFFDRDGERLKDYSCRQARLMELLVHGYPEAIRAIKPAYGFHFDDGGYILAAETERFLLYQVLPRDKKVKVRKAGKPVIVIHPYVLGPNILAFLPDERKSYVHAFADQGIPAYIRIIKDIDTTPAVQTMTGEDDARDTRHFCERVKAAHGRPVTLNGFCQGGFMAVLDILTGELDGLVDALITCVAPMDGTRSLALVEYMQHLPPRFRDLGYAVKDLPNGNRVVDGKVMSWVYKLKSMEKEFSMVTLHRDLMNLEGPDGREIMINATAAAMNHWLIYDRNDLPEAITRISFDSYTVPVAKDGTIPVKLFGRTLNFKGIGERGIPWLICYADKDDLVDKPAALAPLDYVKAEVAVFPKGHGAIATSWSQPDTECALHKRFGAYRGPVRFQLDLEGK